MVSKNIIKAEETLQSILFKGNKYSSKLIFDFTTGQSNYRSDKAFRLVKSGLLL